MKSVEGFKLNRRQKILLLFLGADSLKSIDPIRIMKGLFVFTMEAPETWIALDERYQFVAYDYGPCSFEIYSDLDLLQSQGYVQSHELPGKSWCLYSLTSDGMIYAQNAAKEFSESTNSYLAKIRQFVSQCGFRQLLEVIYRKYPSFAVNSVFKF
jgi:hypothetical protein